VVHVHSKRGEIHDRGKRTGGPECAQREERVPLKVVAIVQARMNSTRLPGKMLLDLAGHPIIWWTLERVQRASGVDEIWLACSDAAADDPLAKFAGELGVSVYRGDEQDVLSRFGAVGRQSGADAVVRLTGDCPLASPSVIDLAIDRYRVAGVDYVSNLLERSYPDGLDVEVFSGDALARADAEAVEPFLREHVTPYIHGRVKDRLPWGNFSIEQIVYPVDFSHLRWTVDELDDLVLMRSLISKLPEQHDWLDAVAEMTRNPELLLLNRHYRLNEGSVRSLRAQEGGSLEFERSNKFFLRAQQTVPLASQTFSKSHQQWVRGAAPLFLSKGRGCRVVDLDGNTYIDYVQGLLANTLGYCDPDVDMAVLSQQQNGVSFSLPTRLEAELAERLARLIPCAEMSRFGKNGSDATTAAIRLSRAYTGRDKVALCGYHGWHDWYIGTTTRDLGVPSAVADLSTTFSYNDVQQLTETLQREPDAYAAVILEAAGSQEPAPGFLETIRDLTARHGVVLVFDEIITGFRAGLGGAQGRYGVIPDLACFGKGMANGYPLSAVVGGRELMQGMEKIFFSGTYGGEALSLAAAIATVDKLERENVPERLERVGADLTQMANRVLTHHGLDQTLRFAGNSWWPRLLMDAKTVGVDAGVLTSLWRQEMVANGLLLMSSFNLCLPHEEETVAHQTERALDAAAASLAGYLNSPDPARHLRGEPVRPTFSVR
jgi:glutamate-1-semialdehyde 2,1-aminomutase